MKLNTQYNIATTYKFVNTYMNLMKCKYISKKVLNDLQRLYIAIFMNNSEFEYKNVCIAFESSDRVFNPFINDDNYTVINGTLFCKEIPPIDPNGYMTFASETNGMKIMKSVIAINKKEKEGDS